MPAGIRFAQVRAFRDGRFAVLPLYTEDVVWEDDPGWPDAQVWHGRDGVRRALEDG